MNKWQLDAIKALDKAAIAMKKQILESNNPHARFEGEISGWICTEHEITMYGEKGRAIQKVSKHAWIN